MLAWGMILKGSLDELDHIKRCLDSVSPHVDGLFITVTNQGDEQPPKDLIKVLESYDNMHISYFHWDDQTFPFGEARQYNLEQIPDHYDFWGWCDADDTLEDGDRIKNLISQWPESTNAVFVKYEYDHDKMGNAIDVHYLPRLLRHNGAWEWDGKRIHETLVEKRQGGKARNDEVWFKHHSDGQRRQESLKRNVKALELLLSEEQAEPDPRTMFYLGGAYYDIGDYDSSRELYEAYLRLSGWDDERQVAWIKLGQINRGSNNPKAKECFALALVENSKNPEPYLELGKTELEEENYDKAIHWLEMAIIQKPNPNTVAYNPLNRTYIPYLLLAQAHMSRGGDSLRIAHKWALKAYEVSKDEPTKKIVDATRDLFQERATLIQIIDKLKVAKTPEEGLEILSKVPDKLQDNPIIVGFRNKYIGPKEWAKSVVIYTGEAIIGEWGPWSLADGIGGSEEAVVRLSKWLSELGWAVTIYGTPGTRAGVYKGVDWKNYWEANLEDDFDIFIGWRNPALFDIKIKANKKYLWLHDVMPPEDFTEDRLDNLDKVMVLSDYHRGLFPNIPDNKIMMTSNGIDPDEFRGSEKAKKIQHKIVYTSSHVRGLKYLYDIWPEVREAVPNATLDIFYGWHSYDRVNQNNPERMQWKAMMIESAEKLDGVTDHGKVSQERIKDEMVSADIWAYPCPFPEVYCITAIKAQASGAWPVASQTAALAETVKFGDTTTIENWTGKERKVYTEMLIRALKDRNKNRKEMIDWAKTKSWEAVAKQWDSEFSS